MTEAISQNVDTEEVANTYREIREYARGKMDVEHHDVHPIAGLIEDDDVRELLVFLAENYDQSFLCEQAEEIEGVDPKELREEMPRSFWETEFARSVIEKHATDLATQAIADGNINQAAFLTGLPSYRADISGLHAIHRLREWLVDSEQCKLIYLAALMGRGKTDLALTFFEIVADHYQRLDELTDDDIDVPEPEFAANFYAETPEDADVEILSLNSERELLEWAEGGSSEDVRWFIFDEASTELTAQSGKNAQKVAETFAPFVKKMRKLGINMIVIGHDKGDVHPAVRALADFVDKVGLKSASFYAGIKNREPAGHLFDIEGIPPTSWTFDTDDMAEWTWIADEEGEEDAAPQEDPLESEEFLEWRDRRLAMLYQEFDISYRELGNAIGVGKDTVGNAVRKFTPADDSSRHAAASGD